MAAISAFKSLSLLMGLPLRSGLSLSRTNTRVRSEFHVAVRLMRAVLKSDVVLPGSERRLGGTKGQKMSRLKAIIETRPILTICLLCAFGLLVSLAVSVNGGFEPGAGF